MRHLSSAAVLALALAVPAAAQAQQRPRVQLAVTHAVSIPNGGWRWAEDMRLTGLRVSVPARGAVHAWAGAASAEINHYACPAAGDRQCGTTGDAWMFQAGADYRFRDGASLVPYAGAGASLEAWEGGARSLMPHIHAGLDWRPVPVVGWRVEAQSEWQFPARLAAGVVFALP